MSNNKVFAEFLYCNGGAKYVKVGLPTDLATLDIVPGLQKISLQSSDRFKVTGPSSIYEFTRTSFNERLVTSLSVYRSSIDWELGDRSNFNCINISVIDGLVDFDLFIKQADKLLDILDQRVLPTNNILDLLSQISSTYGEWQPLEEFLGANWTTRLLDRQTCLVKQSFDHITLSLLIKDLSRFGSGVPFFDEIVNYDRIFIDPSNSLSYFNTIKNFYTYDPELLLNSVLDKFGKLNSDLISKVGEYNARNRSLDDDLKNATELNDQLIKKNKDLQIKLELSSDSDRLLADFKDHVAKYLKASTSIGQLDPSILNKINQNVEKILRKTSVNGSVASSASIDLPDDNSCGLVGIYGFFFGVLATVVLMALVYLVIKLI